MDLLCVCVCIYNWEEEEGGGVLVFFKLSVNVVTTFRTHPVKRQSKENRDCNAMFRDLVLEKSSS